MAVPADFIAPVGELEPSYFPGGDITARIQAYITDAMARVSTWPTPVQAAGIEAWVYYRGYKAAALLINSEPSQMDYEDGSGRQFQLWQVNKLTEEADRWAAKFESYNPGPPVTDSPTSQAIPVTFTW